MIKSIIIIVSTVYKAKESNMINNIARLEEELKNKIEEYYSGDSTHVRILSKNFDKIMINIYFDYAPTIKTKENSILIKNIVEYRLMRIFNLLYYSNDIAHYNFSYNYDYDHKESYLILSIKDNDENIGKIIKKLYDTIIIVLSKSLTISDNDIELFRKKRILLNKVSELGLISLARDNDYNDGEYYDSRLPDIALNNYKDDIHNVFIMNDRELTIEDFKNFCLLLDKEYDIILGVR